MFEREQIPEELRNQGGIKGEPANSEPSKIAIWAPYLYPWHVDFARTLANRGRKVDLYFPDRMGSSYPSAVKEIHLYQSNKDDSGLRLMHIPVLEILGDILPHPKLLIRLFQYRPDALIVFGTEKIGSLLLSLAAQLGKISTIFIIEQNVDSRPLLPWGIRILNTLKKRIAKVTHSRADLLVAESNASKEYAVKIIGCPPNKISVWPHGVDTNRLKPWPPNYYFAQQIGVSQSDLEKVTVLYAGGFYSHKGIEYLAQAIKDDSLQNVVFLIIKFGDLRLASLLDNCPNVRLLPSLKPEDMVNLYSISNIVVLPSITSLVAEISPNVLLEAMACGKAIIATNIGGIPDILSDCGILIQEKDSKALIEAIYELASDADLRSYYGRLARRRAEEVLSMDKYTDLIMGLCAQCLYDKRHTQKEVSRS